MLKTGLTLDKLVFQLLLRFFEVTYGFSEVEGLSVQTPFEVFDALKEPFFFCLAYEALFAWLVPVFGHFDKHLRCFGALFPQF